MAVGNANSANPLDGNYRPLNHPLVAPGTGIVLPQGGVDVLKDTITGLQYSPTVVAHAGGQKATYSATKVGLVPAASPTDVFTVTGGATVVVRVTHIEISGTTDSPVPVALDCLLLKRSTADTAGTSTNSPALIPHDSGDVPAVATVLAYTANPTLGTLVGTAVAAYRSQKLMLTLKTYTATDFPPVVPIVWDFTQRAKPLVLRGITEVLAINLNAVSLVGTCSLNISVEWTEEPL
jgi:hypothetical protein